MTACSRDVGEDKGGITGVDTGVFDVLTGQRGESTFRWNRRHQRQFLEHLQ